MSFLTAVFVKNWHGALTNLNGCGLYEILRLLDQIDRQDLAEMIGVAAGSQQRVNLPRILFAADVVLKRRVPTNVPADLSAANDAPLFLSSRSPLRIPRDATLTLLTIGSQLAPLTTQDFDDGAKRLGAERAAIQAVAAVESGGRSGFGSDGRCIIRYELHTFADRTHHVYDKTHPHLSNAYKAGLAFHAGGQANEWSLLYGSALLRGRVIDGIASSSWGMFQIMGFNFAASGYGSPGEFATAMCESSSNQLKAFLQLCQSNGWGRYLAVKDWAGFAKHYNGLKYADHKYDQRLSSAYKRFSNVP